MKKIQVDIWEEGDNILFRTYKTGVATQNEEAAAEKFSVVLGQAMQFYLQKVEREADPGETYQVPVSTVLPPAGKRKRK